MLIGLTGNFGSGKSTVLKIFASLSAVTVSADEIVHRLLKTDEVKEKIAARLGNVFSENGELDKKKVASLVFADAFLRRFLESLLHPLVMCEVKEIGAKNRDKIVVAEIPLLFEGGFEKDVDKIITVTAGRDVVLMRLGAKGFCEDEVRSRLASQMPDNAKAERSDYVVDNSGESGFVESEIRRIYEKLASELAPGIQYKIR